MNNLTIKKENDRIYVSRFSDSMRSEYYPEFSPVPVSRSTEYKIADHTVSMTTVECILSNRKKHCAALNFANALVPGGAYLIGGTAQEESLCRASMLYYAIKDVKEFYSANFRHITADYTDGIIWTENVPVIRNDSGEQLEEPVMCDFITCPAVNRYESALLIPKAKANEIMERRIERIVSLAEQRKPGLIILGAFGCGAFGNKREDILPMFERAINKFTSDDTDIIFAIP